MVNSNQLNYLVIDRILNVFPLIVTATLIMIKKIHLIPTEIVIHNNTIINILHTSNANISTTKVSSYKIKNNIDVQNTYITNYIFHPSKITITKHKTSTQFHISN